MPARKKQSKKRTGATRNAEKSASNFSYIVISIIVIAFVGFLFYLDKIPTDDKQLVIDKKESSTQQKLSVKKNTTQKPKHQFDFYTVLPDRKVEVNDIDDDKYVKKSPPKPVPKVEIPQESKIPSLYQLQVGAFKELSKADGMKAQLAFLGVESNIQVIQNKGQKMYRVRVGPSTDEKKIIKIQNQLNAKNIKTFMQKLKG